MDDDVDTDDDILGGALGKCKLEVLEVISDIIKSYLLLLNFLRQLYKYNFRHLYVNKIEIILIYLKINKSNGRGITNETIRLDW